MMIEEMTQPNEEIYRAFCRLIPQLTLNSTPPSMKELHAMFRSQNTIIFIARDEEKNNRIIGSATLGLFQSPTGRHGWIEDVIVDGEFRRRGIGKALTLACLKKAIELGLKEVNLTSRPSREAANQLYQSIGFELRETNVYRFGLGQTNFLIRE